MPKGNMVCEYYYGPCNENLKSSKIVSSVEEAEEYTLECFQEDYPAAKIVSLETTLSKGRLVVGINHFATGVIREI